MALLSDQPQPPMGCKTPDVLCIGECMVELSASADAGMIRMGFAGDTYNTAWYLRALRPDWNIRYFTAVGEDEVSVSMLGAMRSAGIDTSDVQRESDRTVGIYLISVRDGERSFSYWRNQSAARMLARDPSLLERSMTGAALIYVSGITMAILEDAGRETMMRALQSARKRGSLIAFDPNLRPGLWPDIQTMHRVITDTAALSDIVMPSFDDEARHFGDCDPQATLARYARGGARTLIVKNGPGDVLYRYDGVTGQVSPPPVANVVDTTSAGDSFNAGALSCLLSGKSVQEAIRQGSAIAAQVIGQRGALVSILTPTPASIPSEGP